MQCWQRNCCCISTMTSYVHRVCSKCIHTMQMMLLQSFQLNIPAVVHKRLFSVNYRGKTAEEEFPLHPDSQ